MSHSTSPLVLNANRRNARKSTGPTSPEGKARVAQNACKHGLLSAHVVVRDQKFERTADFERLRHDLTVAFSPSDEYEQLLVDRIATCYWRLRRAMRFEAGSIRDVLHQDSQRDPEPSPRKWQLEEQIAKVDSAIYVKQAEISLCKTPVEKLTQQQQGARESFLYERVRRAAESQEKLSDPAYCAQTVIAAQEELRELNQQRDRLQQELSRERDLEQEAGADSQHDGALPSEPDLKRLVRYEALIDRELHRALNALHRRQSLHRRDRSPAAAGPEP